MNNTNKIPVLREPTSQGQPYTKQTKYIVSWMVISAVKSSKLIKQRARERGVPFKIG